MELCSEKHGDLAFEGRDCPACKVIDDLQYDHEELEKEKNALQSEFDELAVELNDLEVSFEEKHGTNYEYVKENRGLKAQVKMMKSAITTGE